ncbi:MAG TPA: FRG domain-containing protein [Longimicrobiales bacterium]|nr:FRG domain-containing protein [Longimicrobiales bacterium]
MNTGRTQLLMGPSGIVTDDTEALHAVLDERGRIVLRSGVEFPRFMYRGQPEECHPCLPALGRMRTREEQLLALCQTVAFEDALGGHPAVRVAEATRFLGSPLRIDRTALAQHYGMATDLLDFTSNFDIASFFATCRWDRASGVYEPIDTSDQPGVIYRTPPWEILAEIAPGVGLEPVGWQPLPRPEQQRAYGLRLARGKDFHSVPAVQVVRFRQCAETSIRIWTAFDRGRALFPSDSTATLSSQARSLSSFSRHQVDRAWGRLDAWHGSTTSADERRRGELLAGIDLVQTAVLTCEPLGPDDNAEEVTERLTATLRKVRCRRVLYPD